jgi:hypothetical protein
VATGHPAAGWERQFSPSRAPIAVPPLRWPSVRSAVLGRILLAIQPSGSVADTDRRFLTFHLADFH